MSGSSTIHSEISGVGRESYGPYTDASRSALVVTGAYRRALNRRALDSSSATRTWMMGGEVGVAGVWPMRSKPIMSTIASAVKTAPVESTAITPSSLV